MMVKFLKMVYTGIDRYCYNVVSNSCVLNFQSRLTKLFEPVYITVTRRKLIGNQAFASLLSKSRNEMMPIFFTENTQATQTDDCMHRSKKFMLKSTPDTTNYQDKGSGDQGDSNRQMTFTVPC